MQARFHVGIVALEIDLQVFANPHIFDFAHSEMLHCLPHGCALRIQYCRFWHHHHFGFHLSIYECNDRAPMFFWRKKILSKLLGPR